jgi:hypothetical protein
MDRRISTRAIAKQRTGADFPVNPARPVTYKYTGVSTAGQTVINLGFSVDQANKDNFLLIVDGRTLTEGASNDFVFSAVQSNNTSSQVTLNFAISYSNLNIVGLYMGVLQPTGGAASLSSLQASIATVQANNAKNQLINGNFDIWQRGTSTTVANGVSTYQADRWYAKNSLGTNGVLTYSRVTGSLQGSKYGAQVQITTAPTAAQANGTELYQVLENFQTLELYGQSACFGVNVKALGNVTQVGLQLCYATTEIKPTTFIGSETLVSVNNASFTLAQMVAQAVGTSMTTAGVVGVRIRVTGVSSGNLWDLNNGFIVEQAMLHSGTSLANFGRAGRSIGEEFAMCQRFYIRNSVNLSGNNYNTNICAIAQPWPVTMRATPSFSAPSVAGGLVFSGVTLNSIGGNANTFVIVLNNAQASGQAGTVDATIVGDAEI